MMMMMMMMICHVQNQKNNKYMNTLMFMNYSFSGNISSEPRHCKLRNKNNLPKKFTDFISWSSFSVWHYCSCCWVEGGGL